jgi:hypothetical protein
MNEKQAKFLELAKYFEELKDKVSEVGDQLNTAMKDLGVDTYVQDPETRLVYKIVKPNGTFVEYREIGYKRTAKEGERGGTVLAKKEAEEAGFDLKK